MPASAAGANIDAMTRWTVGQRLFVMLVLLDAVARTIPKQPAEPQPLA